MAKDAANDISYYLLIENAYKADLANIRQWHNLKVGFEENEIWLKDFDYAQIHSSEVKCIPYKTLFYSQKGKLFLLGSHLPDRNIPSLLWTPIDRALPISLPSFNHNYFGITEKVSVSLVQSSEEIEAEAMITSIEILKRYIETAPGVRLQKLKWVIINNDKVFLYGKPLLPIEGNVFWQKGNSIIPAGYAFDLHFLSGSIEELINKDRRCLIVWDTDSSYFLVEKNDLQPLSLSSFRLSIQKLSATV